MHSTVLFLILLLASVGLALVAVYRQRPATFIYASSQALLLRSLLTFAEEGRPETLSYTPRWVFSVDILSVAANIFCISVAMLAISLVLPAPGGRLDPHSLPPLPRWALWVLGAYFLVLVVSQRSIFFVAYASEGQQVFDVPMGGVQTIMSSTLLYEVCRRVWIRQWSVVRGLAVVGAVFLLTDFIRGATGIAMGYIVVTAMLLWQSTQTRLRAAAYVLALIACVSIFSMLVRMTRGDVHQEGLASVEAAADKLTSNEGGAGHADEAASGPQFATHVLDCIALYDAGRSREWRSLSDPVIFTFEPSFLTGPLGLERPVSAPWELSSYFIHLGGLSVFGEAYWNGGYLGVFVFLTLILGLCYFCDSRYRSSFAWLILLLNVAPVLLAGLNYGFSYEFRAVVNGLLQLAVFRLILPRQPLAFADRPSPVLPSAASAGTRTATS